VPGRVSIVGFDDIELADLMTPRLSTIRQPIGQIGQMAIETLESRVADPGRAEQRYVLPVELVVRESSAAPYQAVAPPPPR